MILSDQGAEVPVAVGFSRGLGGVILLAQALQEDLQFVKGDAFIDAGESVEGDTIAGHTE